MKSSPGWRIGVDGGGTKTECVLLNPAGEVAARHTGPGCSPTHIGAARAAAVTRAAIEAVRARHAGEEIAATLLCMAGSGAFWRSFAAGLTGVGAVAAADDSLPVLELATRGGPGMVVHAGTGSFVAARGPDGAAHYAGGLGWRFGDEGSGYDIGRRAVARAVLELQGWARPSGIGELVREGSGHAGAAAVLGHYYAEGTAAGDVAALAPGVLAVAEAGDTAASEVVTESVVRLLGLAISVVGRVFAGRRPDPFVAAASGPILNHPFSQKVLSTHSPFPLARVTEAPIEGVRLLLLRTPVS